MTNTDDEFYLCDRCAERGLFDPACSTLVGGFEEQPETHIVCGSPNPDYMRADHVAVDGRSVSLAALAPLMDDDIRESIHAEGIDDPQKYIDEYLRRDPSLRDAVIDGGI